MDFSYANLQGRSFNGQDLTSANFSHADICGANFAHANLTGANFSGAKAGIAKVWVLFILISVFAGACLAGVLLGYTAGFLSSISAVTHDLSNILKEINLDVPEHTVPTILELLITTGLPLGVMALMGIIMVRRGLRQTIGFSVLMAVSLVIIATFIPDLPGPQREDLFVGFLISRSIMLLGNLGGIVVSAVSIAVAIKIVPKFSLFVTGLTLFFGTMVGLGEALTGAITGSYVKVTPEPIEWLLAGIIAASFGALSLYIARCSHQGDIRYGLIHDISIIISTLGGTSFRGANLTDANFSRATLNSADFRQSLLTRSNWYRAQNLDQSRIEGTYLANASIRRLVVTKHGHEQIFDRQALRHLNLQHANLTDASFIGTDLSGSNLQQADLSRAKLVQTQLYRTNLTEAILTGAYIQDWAISVDTELRQVHCDYVFMRLPTKGDPDPVRKPDSRQKTFAEGEFTDFISPILKTLDLYQQQDVDMLNVAATAKTLDLFHHGGLDPSAAAIALKQLAELFPEAGLEVVALEGRGNERVRVQARVTGDADRSQLSEAYFTQYQQVESMAYGDIQALMRGIEEKDERIRSLESMVMSALKEEKYYVESVYHLGGNDAANVPAVKTTILVLAANPRGSSPLRLGEEVRLIQAGLERSRERDRFQIQQRWAVTATDVRRALLDCQPQIVHFSGHGVGMESVPALAQSSRDLGVESDTITPPEGLIFEDESGQPHVVSTEAIASLFSLFADSIEGVILNACYSSAQAEAIAEHIPFVIGMKRAIGDRAAIQFSIGFYDALLAGRPIDFAFELGCSAIQMEGIPEHLTPILKHKPP